MLPFQAKNYYKGVSENKEIVKLVSVLSTSINSNKKVTSLSHVYGVFFYQGARRLSPMHVTVREQK